ncbi:Transposon Ty3-I Gag-Pol polyprotein [Thelohanellus kitauei]|uniref:Transposon Ty3-I Gag-Pol polyprotein n=1 Tax=Thelohanellus kitauei TaxID=669202 RepID=A0A0C2J8Z3_THEKT|nr:Transposon Ty3-I Gag-Pol polyprotein [Thelohanellus kitauei]
MGLNVNKLHTDQAGLNSQTKLERILETYKEVFTNNTRGIKGYTTSIKLRSACNPKVFKPRNVPYAVRNQVEQELERLSNEGILQKFDDVSSPLSWASPIVVIEKPNGQLRICGDFKVSINKHIDYLPYPLPTFRDILEKIKGGQRFSVIDLKEAYLQIPLDEQASNLTVISTHSGFFKFKRLPFGISSAPSIFQNFMDTLLHGINNVTCYIDDIIITGTDDKNHLQNLERVLNKLKEFNVTTSIDKCKFFQSEVKFLGHIINKEGVRPIDERITPILNLPAPKNVAELKSF